ncbi:MAG: hypothetical protein V3W04_00385 [Gammaproteobacteria bacterium]
MKIIVFAGLFEYRSVDTGAYPGFRQSSGQVSQQIEAPTAADVYGSAGAVPSADYASDYSMPDYEGAFPRNDFPQPKDGYYGNFKSKHSIIRNRLL